MAGCCACCDFKCNYSCKEKCRTGLLLAGHFITAGLSIAIIFIVKIFESIQILPRVLLRNCLKILIDNYIRILEIAQ